MSSSPINDVTKIDLLGERVDGGLDMGIVARAPLDGSSDTLARVEQKVRNYLREALDDSFQKEFGIQRPDQITILFESKFAIDVTVMGLLSTLAKETEVVGVKLVIRRY